METKGFRVMLEKGQDQQRLLLIYGENELVHEVCLPKYAQRAVVRFHDGTEKRVRAMLARGLLKEVDKRLQDGQNAQAVGLVLRWLSAV